MEVDKYFVPRMKKRIVALTEVKIIESKILTDLETIIKSGYEVFLLTGKEDDDEVYAIKNRINIERVRLDPYGNCISNPYRISSMLINYVNKVSVKFDSLINKISIKVNTFFNKYMELKNLLFNSISLRLQRKLGNLATRNANNPIRYKIIIFVLKSSLKLIISGSKVMNIIIVSKLRVFNLSIKVLLKFKKFIVIFLRKVISVIPDIFMLLKNIITNSSELEEIYKVRTKFYRPDVVLIYDAKMHRLRKKLKKNLKIPVIYDLKELISLP